MFLEVSSLPIGLYINFTVFPFAREIANTSPDTALPIPLGGLHHLFSISDWGTLALQLSPRRNEMPKNPKKLLVLQYHHCGPTW